MGGVGADAFDIFTEFVYANKKKICFVNVKMW